MVVIESEFRTSIPSCYRPVITEIIINSPFRFGYIDFSDVATAEKAMKAMQGARVDGRNVTLDFAAPREDRPARGGRGGGRGFGGGRGKGNQS